jgi:hypothetical protein
MPNNAIALQGHLRVTAIDAAYIAALAAPLDLEDAMREGAAEIVLEKANTIMDVGLSLITRLLGFGRGLPSLGPIGVTSVNDLKIDTMRLGNANAPATPGFTDSALSTLPVYSISPLTMTYPSATRVIFNGLLPAPAIVGTDITEEGIFLPSDILVARIVFAPITKLATHALMFSHYIDVTRA